MNTECHLPRTFFNRPTLEVAQDLIGKTLVFHDKQGIITETEAYCGADDPASHAFRGKTPRTAVMFGLPGYSYVYFIYGMYHCFNVVTEEEGKAGAVLIRGVLIDELHLNGPGKLCRHLNITKKHNGIDLINSPDFYFADNNYQPLFDHTPRIGIKVAQDRLWRFVIKKPII